MTRSQIVRAQKISAVKLERAKEMRKRPTPAESRLWQALRRSQLDGLKFRRQQIIDGFIVDFYCPAAGLVIEIDEPIHAEHKEYDAERSRVLKSHGLRILRLGNDEVLENLAACLERIRTACGGDACA